MIDLQYCSLNKRSIAMGQQYPDWFWERAWEGRNYCTACTCQ